jgi:hypothetical protein
MGRVNHPIRATMRSGGCRIAKPSSAHGQRGTYTLTGSRSIAVASSRQPVAVSIMKGVFFTFSLISERI